MKIFLACGLLLFAFYLSDAQDSLMYDCFVIPVSAQNAADGRIDLRITSGTGPFTYYWSSGVHQENQNNLSAGTYFCTVVDGFQDVHKIFAEVHAPGAFDWDYVNTGENHTILVPENSLEGINVQPGDFIGVFYRLDYQMICGGYMEYTAPGNFAVTAWGDASMSPEKDGFAPQEAFVFAWYDASSQRQYFLQSEFDSENFPNQGFYLPNGISGVAKIGNISQELSANSPLESIDCYVFPNPASSMVFIRWPMNQTRFFRIFSGEGKVVFEKESGTGEFSIPVNDWPEGIYLLTAGGRAVSKLIVLHH